MPSTPISLFLMLISAVRPNGRGEGPRAAQRKARLAFNAPRLILPVTPVRRTDIDPLLRDGVYPAIEDAAAGEDKLVLACRLDHGKLKITAERRRLSARALIWISCAGMWIWNSSVPRSSDSDPCGRCLWPRNLNQDLMVRGMLRAFGRRLNLKDPIRFTKVRAFSKSVFRRGC